ncbi:stealth family protein [Kitasatospora sp. NPDC050543]|uniref:stealth family protein n=1 Tax=Kitasatospora sp. NPDC050543 TaxID=3364054 RepID=UPI0037AD38A6
MRRWAGRALSSAARRAGPQPATGALATVAPAVEQPSPEPPRQPEPQPEPPERHEALQPPEPVEPVEQVDPTAEGEARLLAAHPGLVRHRGQLAEVRDDLLSGEAFLAALTMVAEVLDDAGIAFSPLPDGRARYRLAIAPGHRAAVLHALADRFTGLPVYADLLGHDVTLATGLAEDLPAAVARLEPTPPPERPEPPEPPDSSELSGPPDEQPPDEEPPVKVKGVRIYRPVVTSRGTLGYAGDHGCDIEFWDSAAPSHGAIASISETPYGWWVPSLERTGTVRIGGRDYPTADAFTRPRAEEVTFPVDAVITWVDDTDPAWLGRRARARAARGAGAPGQDVEPVEPVEPVELQGDGDERFRNRDELRYCLRSIAMYAPWIRHVYLVTDDQTPSWLDTDHPAVTVVSHREIFAAPDALPVFNSHAIETQLHRIPGLGEHFVYFNDDVFLARPVRPEQFFLGNGASQFVFDSRIIPPGGVEPGDDEYVASQKTTRQLLERECGRTTTKVLSHVPHALRRSLLAEAAERFGEELGATARSTFRSGTDIAPITLAAYLGYFSGQAIWGWIDHRHLDVDRYDSLAQLPDLLEWRPTDIICLNDGAIEGVPRQEQDRLVTSFLQDYFPVPSPFERPDSPPV